MILSCILTLHIALFNVIIYRSHVDISTSRSHVNVMFQKKKKYLFLTIFSIMASLVYDSLTLNATTNDCRLGQHFSNYIIFNLRQCMKSRRNKIKLSCHYVQFLPKNILYTAIDQRNLAS